MDFATKEKEQNLLYYRAVVEEGASTKKASIKTMYLCYRLYAHKICQRIVRYHMRMFSNKKLCAH